jgi:hypothetical protein
VNTPLRRIAVFSGLLIPALLLRDMWLQSVKAVVLNTNGHNGTC